MIVNDFDAMAVAIRDLLQDKVRRRQLVTAASEFVRQLSWDAIVRQYLPILIKEGHKDHDIETV